MKISRRLNILCIIAGGIIAIYAQAGGKQNVYVLIIGIVLLVFGIYRTSRNIPSKQDNDNESFVKEEPFNEDESR